MDIHDRNREIGQILLAARTRHRLSVTACAARIGTSRRRYVAMEQGKAMIGFVEVEELMQYLQISSHEVGGIMNSRADDQRNDRQVELHIKPGETICLVLESPMQPVDTPIDEQRSRIASGPVRIMIVL